jgi:hypothetical protein
VRILVVTIVFGAIIESAVRRLRMQNSPLHISGRHIPFIAMFGLIFFLVFEDSPWLPAERIDHEDQKAFAGYVLNESDNDLVVLRAQDRHVIRLNVDKIESREICRMSSGWRVFNTGDDYETCPD